MIDFKVPRYLWAALISHNLPRMETAMREEKNQEPPSPKFTKIDAKEARKLWQSGEGMMKNPIQRDTDREGKMSWEETVMGEEDMKAVILEKRRRPKTREEDIIITYIQCDLINRQAEVSYKVGMKRVVEFFDKFMWVDDASAGFIVSSNKFIEKWEAFKKENELC